jgi:hypothetical protein
VEDEDIAYRVDDRKEGQQCLQQVGPLNRSYGDVDEEDVRQR